MAAGRTVDFRFLVEAMIDLNTSFAGGVAEVEFLTEGIAVLRLLAEKIDSRIVTYEPKGEASGAAESILISDE